MPLFERRAPLVCLTLAGAFVVGAPGVAHAQDSAAIAEQLFRNGRALMAAGKTAEGCEQLASSERVGPALGTRLNLAVCREKEGKLATAWSLFTRVEDEASRAGDAPRAKLAHEHAAALAPKLSKLVIDLPSPPPGTTVTLDALSIPVAVLGTQLPVDAGDHTLAVNAPGKSPWSQEHVRVGADASVVHVRVELHDGSGPVEPPPPVTNVAPPEPTPGAPPTAEPPPSTSPAPASPPPASPGTISPQVHAGFGIGGVGVIAMGFVIYYGVTVLDRRGDESNYPAGSASQQKVYQEAKDAQTGEIVSGVLGLVALGTGATLVLTAPRHEGDARAAASTSFRFVPTIGLHGGGLRGVVTF